MNYIVNILVFIIFIGLYNLRTVHLEKNLVLVSVIFLTLLSILYKITNSNSKKESFSSSQDDIKLLQTGQFEIVAFPVNSKSANRTDLNYYLHSTIPRSGKSSDCLLSAKAGCRDVCVVNLNKHEENQHFWTFNKRDSYYEIKYGNLYLTRTPNKLPSENTRDGKQVIGDCANIYGNSSSCYNVILVKHDDFKENPTYWIFSKKQVANSRPNSLYYQIQAYFDDTYQNFYLYTTLTGEDGQDCEDAGMKQGGGKCRNVFLAPDNLDNSKITQNANPIYWRFIVDPQSAPDTINMKENEIQIKVSSSEMPGWYCTQFRVSGQTDDNKYLCTNKTTEHKYFSGKPPPSSQWKCVQIGPGADYICLPRSTKYKFKNIPKHKIDRAEEDGYSTTTYDLNENFIGIKQLDEAEDNVLSIPPGLSNIAVKDKCTVLLSSEDKTDPTLRAVNVLDEDLHTYCESIDEHNPKLHMFLKKQYIMQKFVIRQNIKHKDNNKNLYPIAIKVYDGQRVVYDQTFTEATTDDDGVYVIEDILITGDLVIIEIPNQKAVLSLHNVFIMGKPAHIAKQDENVQNAIKNEQALNRIMQRQMQEKHDSHLRESVSEVESATKERTVQDLLSFINTPQSVIIWENIGIKSKSVKLELLRREFLHISNIQVFGSSIRDTNQKNWANDRNTTINMSSIYEDDSGTYYGPENTVNDELDTYCRSLNTENPFPSLTLIFEDEIIVDKIIIYNRKDKNRERLVPCKISLMDNKNQTIVHAIKETFNKNLMISKSFMQSPLGCLSFDELNIKDIGDINRFRGWADVEGNGMKCNFCRVVGNPGQQYFSCASSTGDNEYAYNTLPNVDLGAKDSIFMADLYGSGKDDFCRCVGSRYNQHVESIVNNINLHRFYLCVR